jgi:hypothetical protein
MQWDLWDFGFGTFRTQLNCFGKLDWVYTATTVEYSQHTGELIAWPCTVHSFALASPIAVQYRR